jgi:RNA polymerase sigma-70 factor (ECF subfamily)
MNIDGTGHTVLVALTDEGFKESLTKIIPHLRAFARTLCGDKDVADDLVQETMMKAWAARTKFEAGSNFKAWTFTILRNHYFSQTRRRRFSGEWDDLTAERILAAPASQTMSVELRDLSRALQQLPAPQREALILVGAGGISYEETAEIAGVAVGTVKSRVARGRAALEAIFESGILAVSRAEYEDDGDAVVNIFAYLEQIQRERACNRSLAASPADLLAA